MSDPRLAALETLRLRLCGDMAHPDFENVSVAAPDPSGLGSSLRADGTWADVDYANDALKDWATVVHLRRLRGMAREWFRPESPACRQDALLQSILRGLDGWYALNPVNPNWWWNCIGAPLLLGETLLLIKDACPPSYIERAIPAFRTHEPILRFTGQNLVWTASVVIYQGLLTGEPALVSQGFILIGREVRVLPDEEGIQPDMSFHQHGKLLYSGGYGSGFAADVGRLMALASGTPYAFPQPLVSLFARFVLDGSRWMVRGNTFDPGVVGREISRKGHNADRFLAGLRHLAAFEHPRQAEAKASVEALAEKGRSLVTGNRHFWNSDLMVQHRPGYYLSVRTTSPRIWNNDMACCGGEGRVCHHMADGATFIMRDGNEYRDVFPVWNWKQVPGTTCAQGQAAFDPQTLRIKGERAFAGGASDGRVGCSAVDFSRGGLRARKAWFLFDDALIALGAGITCAGDDPVRTTLNQCNWRGPAFLSGREGKLPEGVYPLTAGSAFWHDGVSYRVLDGAGSLRLGPQTGAWSDCGVGSPEPLTLPVLNAGLDHGLRPAGATYAYAVQPDVAGTGAFQDDPLRFVRVRNDPALQAVWHAGERRGQAVFYEPGAVVFPDGQQIEADRPCILLYQPGAGGCLTFTLAQPEQGEGLLTLRLKGPAGGALGVSLPVRDYAGSSLTLTWQA